MDITQLTVFGVVAIIALYTWSVYNGLATRKVRIKEALSSIDIQLKRRVDLIPNLVETVKGYVKHEKGTLEAVTKARTALMRGKTLQDKMASNNMLSDALKTLFAVAEDYPDLKASQNFLELQEELEDTENKIAYARQFFNSNVMEYNTLMAAFPSGPIGRMFGFREEPFFFFFLEEKKPVKVTF